MSLQLLSKTVTTLERKSAGMDLPTVVLEDERQDDFVEFLGVDEFHFHCLGVAPRGRLSCANDDLGTVGAIARDALVR